MQVAAHQELGMYKVVTEKCILELSIPYMKLLNSDSDSRSPLAFGAAFIDGAVT